MALCKAIYTGAKQEYYGFAKLTKGVEYTVDDRDIVMPFDIKVKDDNGDWFLEQTKLFNFVD